MFAYYYHTQINNCMHFSKGVEIKQKEGGGVGVVISEGRGGKLLCTTAGNAFFILGCHAEHRGWKMFLRWVDIHSD